MTAIANVFRAKTDPKIVETGPSSLSAADNLARGLGWFSIGLGLVELVVAGKLARALGLEGRQGLIRAFGVREIGAGVATLSTEREVGLWSRVAGDMLDLLTLATALDAPPRQRANAKLALAAVAGITALDVIGARALSAERARGNAKPRTYFDRSGLPGGVAASRGAAKSRAQDMRAAQSA